jgi:LuxR family maltose regulon positive regulatory protein
VLWERLGEAARVTVLSAAPGSGKTVLLRSWISAAGLAEYAAWVPAGRDEGDPQRLWLAMLDALRQTAPGSGLVRPLTAAPDLDGWAIMARLLTDLAPLRDQLWLVLDDLHELDSDQARRQLELLVMRAPAELRFVMATRHDVRLGLHRLRLEGELTEIRADDLRFTVAEARALFQAAGVELPGPTLALLMDRTEGWAAGLRLAALSLAGHPDPERFAKEFSGSERTVAEYLLAEVLDRQSEQVRRLLLRTSVLERVNGELADLLTGSSGGERVLQDLEEANAFVVSLHVARSWFRYHHLFADLLQLELRRTEPGEVAALHELAAGWFADHGFGVEAVRHAQAAQDWDRAARLLADHWAALKLGGRTATVHALLAGFPAAASFADAELAAVAAADELAQGSLLAAERYLDVAERGQASVPLSRRRQAQVLLGVVRLLFHGRSGDQRARAEQAQRLLAAAEAPAAAQPMKEASDGGTGRLAWGGEELRTLALLEIGNAQTWTGRFEAAECHLDQAVALARRIRWPYLEFMGLVYRAEMELSRRLPRAAELSRQAIDLAERHGWTRRTPGCSVRSGRSERRRTRRRRWGATTSAASSSSGAAGPPARCPRSGPPSIWPDRTRSPGRCEPGSCSPWYGSVTPSAPSGRSPISANATATAGRCASPRRRCGSPSTTRPRQPPRSRRSWTAPPRAAGDPGWPRLSSWRRSPGTRSAIRPPPGTPWSARSISPNPTGRSCGSCCTPHRACSSGRPGSAPRMRH